MCTFKNRSAGSETALSPLLARCKISNSMINVLYSINKKKEKKPTQLCISVSINVAANI